MPTLELMICTVGPEPRALQRSPSAAKRFEAPADVYYVVETTGAMIGKRQHRVSSSLYETPSQAHAALARLVTANSDNEYSVWKGSTYIEPANWAYDVVLADGTVLHPKPAHERRTPG